METIQQILLILGVIALAIAIIFLVAGIYVLLHIKRKMTEITDHIHLMGNSLSDVLRNSGKAIGMMGGGGLIFRIAKNLLRRRR
jgi:hypothetical protein